MASVFLILGIALIVAALIGYVSTALKQPLILAYIITGFLLGPEALALFTDIESVQVLSEMGITFLLFTVGLSMSIKSVSELGWVSTTAGTLQVLFTTLAGFFVSLYFGFSTISSLYIGVALAFSSTIIIVKLLSEKNEINSLHGRISIGFLLVQDFIAILALVLITGIGIENGNPWGHLGLISIKALLLVIFLIVLSRYALPSLFRTMAKNQELLFLSSISYCFLLSIASYFLGLSIEIGAFLAGISLASLPYNLDIAAKIKPLRDFFIVIFFISLGAQMGFTLSANILVPLIVLSILVLVGNPLILLLIMGSMGYRRRTSFLVGLTVAQISEFSLILVALGHKMGHIGLEVVSLVTSVGVITITISAYMIIFGHKLYYKLSPYLSLFERATSVEQEAPPETVLESNHIIVVGYHRIGYGIVKKLTDLGRQVVVVDFDPVVIRHLQKQGVPCLYGDIGDPDILQEVNLAKADIIVSTVPDMEDNLKLMKKAREVNPHVTLIMTAEHVEEALDLYEDGADYVILPHILGGHHASILLEEMSTNIDKLIATKVEHLEELKKRKDIHPHHRKKDRK